MFEDASRLAFKLIGGAAGAGGGTDIVIEAVAGGDTDIVIGAIAGGVTEEDDPVSDDGSPLGL